MPELHVHNLEVAIDSTRILQGVTLGIKPGEVVALVGPNGSGKSTLANVLMGHPQYHVLSGNVSWGEKDLLSLKPEERAKAGLFMSFQHPQEIAGISVGTFLRLAYNSVHDTPLSVRDFVMFLKKKASLVHVSDEFLVRSVNEGFSGGEKKRAELLQLAVLQPKLAILDEIDSGLDMDGLKMVGQVLQAIRAEQPDMSLLLITHYQRLLDVIPADRVVVMRHGKIVYDGEASILRVIEQKGYDVL